jgi:hypothetical protein
MKISKRMGQAIDAELWYGNLGEVDYQTIRTICFEYSLECPFKIEPQPLLWPWLMSLATVGQLDEWKTLPPPANKDLAPRAG